MWIGNHPVLHIIDRGTRYSVARFMKNESSEQVWNIIVEFWITVFTGYPNIIFHDLGRQFTAKYFHISCSRMGVITKESPTQSHNSLGLCGRYHSIIRRIFNKLTEDFPDLERDARLALAVHAIKNTAGPNGLTPTILEFGAIPRIPIPNSTTLLPSQQDRIEAKGSARKEMETITAHRRIRTALKLKHSLRPHNPFKFGDKFRIWRKELQRYVGPYTVHGYTTMK